MGISVDALKRICVKASLVSFRPPTTAFEDRPPTTAFEDRFQSESRNFYTH
jgi:hypothetical protein